MSFRKLLYLLIFFGMTFYAYSQSQEQGKVIRLLYADFTDTNEYEVPGARILTGNVQAQHDSMYIYCNKAYFFEKENYIKLFGNVRMIQNDTLQMTSTYAEYNGLQQIAYASGNVVLTSPDSQLKSEKVYYDRANGVAYYNDHATIKNKENTLKSKAGKYFLHESKYEFRTAVVLTSPNAVIETNHLDYFELPGHAYIFGPSTVTSDKNYIYTENGFYDTRLDQAKLIKNSHIIYDDRRIEADDLYYDKNTGYFKGINNVKVTDTINKIIGISHLAEVYRKPAYDSIFMTKRPLIKTITEQDSAFFHAKNIIITGPDKQRNVKGYNIARMFKEPDMSGKSDTLKYNQAIGLLELIGRPVLFKGESQLSGDLIHLINDPITEKLDSLKVLTNAFVIERDTLGSGYNQAKGINMYGKFIDNDLRTIDLIQNAEMIYYIYDEGELVGIDKSICSRINIELEENKIQTATRYTNPKSITYPPDKFSPNDAQLTGFNWRGDERIKSKEEIILPDEELTDEQLKDFEPSSLDVDPDTPMIPSNKTLNFTRKGTPNKIKNEE